MTISQTPYQRALAEAPLREGDKVFFSTQVENALHQLLLETFLECEQTDNLKRADLARKSTYAPAVITRILSDPSNHRIGTAAVLMAAMGHEITLGKQKIDPAGPRRNYLPSLQSRIFQMKADQSPNGPYQSNSGNPPIVNTITRSETVRNVGAAPFDLLRQATTGGVS